jgi:hypothetical protein
VAQKAAFSSFETVSLNWFLINHLKIQKTFWACLSAAHHAHLCMPWPRNPGCRLDAWTPVASMAIVPTAVPSSLQGAHPPTHLYSHSHSPIPVCMLELQAERMPHHTTLLYSPLCSCHRVITTEAVLSKPWLSQVGICRRDLRLCMPP